MRIGDGAFRDGGIVTEDLDKTAKNASPKAAKHATPRVANPQKVGGAPRSGDLDVEQRAPSPFERILRGLGHEMDRGEAMVRRATGAGGSGRELGNGELLALQAGVYRYSEAVDLAAKLVDRTASGVKTVLQGQ